MFLFKLRRQSRARSDEAKLTSNDNEDEDGLLAVAAAEVCPGGVVVVAAAPVLVVATAAPNKGEIFSNNLRHLAEMRL